MSTAPTIRYIGPFVNAISRLQQSLYQPPRHVIAIPEDAWPNPLQPVTPMGPPGAEPLRFQMNWGTNLEITPRYDAEYGVNDLRQLGRYVLARICIENVKDILLNMPRRIQLKPLPGETDKEKAKRSKGDKNLIRLNNFLDRPNPSEDWDEVLRPVLDDMMVIDAGCIFLGRDRRSNDIIELRWVEGGSITRRVDVHGWTPEPPNIAYQQNWQGYPRLDLTTDQLVYKPRNIVPRQTQSSYLYGMSPIEQLAKEIKIGMSRLQFVYDFYSRGSTPGAMLFAPVGTNVDKIKEAQDFLDSYLGGNLAARRQIQILQGFQTDGKSEQFIEPKEPQLADVFDDLHIRKIAFGLGTSPIRLMRMINRSSGQANQEAAEEEGTLPFMRWMKRTIDYIIQVKMKMPEYELTFDPFQELDALKRAMADSEDVKIGMYTRNEKRKDRGDDPRPEPEADELNVVTAQGLVGLEYRPMPVPGAAGGTGGSSAAGSRTPKGGSQPRASRSAQAGPKKANGFMGIWTGCDTHDGNPTIECPKCCEVTSRRLINFHEERYL